CPLGLRCRRHPQLECDSRRDPRGCRALRDRTRLGICKLGNQRVNPPHDNAPANRLIHETSPYLRQHAHNPVHWYPWGDEALSLARAQDRPIFLSIGYSACHWCHVMERECFENEAIAALMNQHFVNIKVDREERPDIDEIYMKAVVALNGSGGWPM